MNNCIGIINLDEYEQKTTELKAPLPFTIIIYLLLIFNSECKASSIHLIKCFCR